MNDNTIGGGILLAAYGDSLQLHGDGELLAYIDDLDSDGRRALIFDAKDSFERAPAQFKHEYITQLSPNGKWCDDGQYSVLNPARSDKSLGSCFIHPDTGAFKDFASDTRSSDIVGTAAMFSSEPNNQSLGAIHVLQFLARIEHRARFIAQTSWIYYGADGQPLLRATRRELADGKKKFSQSSYGVNGWQHGIAIERRPLYHIDSIIKHPEREIIFCEGEKSADAAQALLGDVIVATTTICGAQSPNKTDFSPCANRNLLIWRDNDDAGIKYQNALVELLTAAGAASIRVYEPDAWCPPKGDAWDYLINGWRPDAGRFTTNTTIPNKQSSPDLIVSDLVSGDVKAMAAAVTAIFDDAGAWPPLQPLFTAVSAKDYPLDALPPNIREVVREINTYNGAPLGLIATCAVSVLSLAIQSKIDCARDSVLRSPVSLFTLTVAEPNERKSAVDSLLMSAIRQFERDAIQNIAKDRVAYETAIESCDIKTAAVKSSLKKSAAGGGDTTELERQLTDLQLSRPIEPAPAKLLYPNATIESLLDGLSRYPSGGVMSAEGGSIFGGQMGKRDNVMMLFSTANQLWSGEYIGAVDRITRQSRRIDNARLTFSLQIQEGVLKTFLRTNGELSHGSGFLARFLIAWPDSTQGTRDYATPPEYWPNLALFHEQIKSILREPLSLNASGGLVCPVVVFSNDAQRLWIDYYNATERSLGKGGANENLRGQAGKAAENVARVAALFEYFGNPSCCEISAQNVDRAIQIVDWHMSEARRLFSPTAGAAQSSDSAKLDAWLLAQCRETGVGEVRKSTALQYCIRRKEQLDAAAVELVELGRIREVKRGGGKGTHFLVVNPALL